MSASNGHVWRSFMVDAVHPTFLVLRTPPSVSDPLHAWTKNNFGFWNNVGHWSGLKGSIRSLSLNFLSDAQSSPSRLPCVKIAIPNMCIWEWSMLEYSTKVFFNSRRVKLENSATVNWSCPNRRFKLSTSLSEPLRSDCPVVWWNFSWLNIKK